MAIAIAALSGQASGAIYWGETTSIGRMNNDGGGSTSVTTPSIANACGVAVDGSHIYWGDKEHGAIGRANLDGSAPSHAFVAGASEPCGVAVDANYVYWANEGSATIGRARLDGSEVRQDFIRVPKVSAIETDAPGLCGLALMGRTSSGRTGGKV